MKKAVVIVLISLIIVILLFTAIRQTREDVSNNIRTINSTMATQGDLQEQKELTSEEKEWEKILNATFAEIECPTPRNLSKLPNSYYKGPMIDTHIHIGHIPLPLETIDADEIQPIMGVNIKMVNYICMMNSEGTTKSLAFFPVWEPAIEKMIYVVNKTLEKYPERFIPFIMPPDHDDRPDGYPTVDAQALEEMLNINPGLFVGYGEIGLYARGDHGGPKGAPELPPNSTRLMEIYPIIRENNLVVYFHLGEGQQDAFEQALEENPDINFIWHGDQLIPYDKGVQNLNYIEEILNNHPNVYYGVDELYGDIFLLNEETTKEEFLAHFSKQEELLQKDIGTWKGFIERHPNQVLWGTDRGWSAPWSLDSEVALTLNNYTRAFIGRIDPSVQEKFAYKNAEKLFD